MDKVTREQFEQITHFVQHKWHSSIIEELKQYITIPCKSPAFDSQWQENNYLEQVIIQFKTWVNAQNIKGLNLDIIRLTNRTPLLYIEITPFQTTNADTILMYGHLDKQPEMSGWDEDKGPWKPVIVDNKLYGRGAADDGYSLFAAVTAIGALQQQNISHPRIVVIIEACEESGSYDLPYYIEHLKDRIQEPSLVICLDSGCGNYEQFWLTTSLRGNIKGVLKVELISEGVHSGMASGIVPSSFRVIRQLLDRIENALNGEILIPDFYTLIPEQRIAEAKLTAKILGETIYSSLPFYEHTQPVCEDHVELLLNRTWRPQLAVTGAEGLPKLSQAGNVMRPQTSLALSLRVPPQVNAVECLNKLKQILEINPPYHARVTFETHEAADGWNSPPIQPWLQQAVDQASKLAFNKPSASWGEGGTIPFMAMLGEKFPQAQFVITGVLGPHSNAHGPNEFLHLDMVEKVTAGIAYIIAQVE